MLVNNSFLPSAVIGNRWKIVKLKKLRNLEKNENSQKKLGRLKFLEIMVLYGVWDFRNLMKWEKNIPK